MKTPKTIWDASFTYFPEDHPAPPRLRASACLFPCLESVQVFQSQLAMWCPVYSPYCDELKGCLFFVFLYVCFFKWMCFSSKPGTPGEWDQCLAPSLKWGLRGHPIGLSRLGRFSLLFTRHKESQPGRFPTKGRTFNGKCVNAMCSVPVRFCVVPRRAIATRGLV